MIRRLLLAGAIAVATMNAGATSREELLGQALGAWNLGQPNAALAVNGSVTMNSVPAGIGARRAARVAAMAVGYFDAGDTIDVSTPAITVYLRAYDPTGSWSSGLVAKRGTHATLNYNLFAVDIGGTDGSDIGFEVRTGSGLHSVSFPVADAGATAWMDIVARYDGEKVQLFANGRLRAEAACSGSLQANDEPLLIGAETDEGSVVRPFTGQMEEAAIFDRALTDEEVALISRTPRVWLEPSVTIHHTQPDHNVGDFRPEFVDGEFIVNYLYNPGTWNCAILRSTDLLHWTRQVPTHPPAEMNQVVPNYFMLSFLRDPTSGKWKSFFGNTGMRASISDDLVAWQAESPQLVLAARPALYARESDPYVYWNEDRQQYVMVMTLGKANVPVGERGAVGWATSSDLRSWTNRGELYFPGNLGDPECPSMFKSGDKWILLASYYDQAVGAPVYRTSDQTQGPWETPFPDRLDGKDFCAGFSVDAGNRRVLFGWIPSNVSSPGNQAWGGHMAFPREIVGFGDGTLGTVLAKEYRLKLPGAATVQPLRAHTGSWTFADGSAAINGSFASGIAALEGTIERVALSSNVAFSETSRRVRVRVDWSPNDAGFAVLIDRENGRMAIETPGGATYADLPLRALEAGSYPLTVYVEDDMIEAFFADRYSLCARIPKKLTATSLALEVEVGPTAFNDLSIRYMNGLNELPAGSVDAPNGWVAY